MKLKSQLYWSVDLALDFGNERVPFFKLKDPSTQKNWCWNAEFGAPHLQYVQSNWTRSRLGLQHASTLPHSTAILYGYDMVWLYDTVCIIMYYVSVIVWIIYWIYWMEIFQLWSWLPEGKLMYPPSKWHIDIFLILKRANGGLEDWRTILSNLQTAGMVHPIISL